MLINTRYVTWIYLAISAWTWIAIQRKYFDLIDEMNVLLRCIRSERATEMTMMANAHWQLHRIQMQLIYWMKYIIMKHLLERGGIESWWRQLSKS